MKFKTTKKEIFYKQNLNLKICSHACQMCTKDCWNLKSRVLIWISATSKFSMLVYKCSNDKQCFVKIWKLNTIKISIHIVPGWRSPSTKLQWNCCILTITGCQIKNINKCIKNWSVSAVQLDMGERWAIDHANCKCNTNNIIGFWVHKKREPELTHCAEMGNCKGRQLSDICAN